MHHADPKGLMHFCKVDMMCECSTGELLAGAAFMHHDDQGHDALKQYAALKWLTAATPEIQQ